MCFSLVVFWYVSVRCQSLIGGCKMGVLRMDLIVGTLIQDTETKGERAGKRNQFACRKCFV